MAVIKNTNSKKRPKKLASISQLEESQTLQINEDGTVTINLDQPAEEASLGLASDYFSKGHYSNLVDLLSEDELIILGAQVSRTTLSDDAARNEWMKTIEFGFDLLGTKVEEKNTPFEGACSAQHPLLMESAVKFQSKASNELLPASGPVKSKILGEASEEKEQRANRIKNHMNYQTMEEMTEFVVDMEKLFIYLPLVGSAFSKTYYSAHLGRPCVEFVPADQFIVPNAASDLYRAPRYTHVLYKTADQMEADFAAGLYQRPVKGLGAPQAPKLTDVQRKANSLLGVEISLSDENHGYTLYEQHVMIYLKGIDERSSEYELVSPYIITINSHTQDVIGIRRNWKEGDSLRKKLVPFTHFSFVPSFNFYSYGFLHLLGNLQLTLTSAMRALVDAGQFATLQGGFKLKGVRIADDGQPIYPGQFKELETAVMDINKAIMPLPFKEPSNVLYQMLQFLDAKGQKFADSTEQVVADAANYGPVGTTMALLEASTKFFSAIHKRLHNSLKHVLRNIYAINAETLDENSPYNVEGSITRDDYTKDVTVVPVSDPNIPSSAHRMAKAQAILETAMRAPHLHDMREVLRHFYANMDYINVDKILPTPEGATQQDALSDIQIAIQGKAIQAFPGQDHSSHIAIKQAFLQNPTTAQSPFMQSAAQAIQANIQEHIFMQFAEQVKAMAGEQVTDEAAMAQAAQQVAQMNMAQLQQQLEQSQHSIKDQATMMLAQAELTDTQTQVRKQEADEKLKTADLILKAQKLKLEAMKEDNRAKEKGMQMASKTKDIVIAKSMDAMIQGLTPKLPKGGKGE